MHKIEIVIRYSNNKMDSWNEGSETKLIIESDKKLVNDDYISKVAANYLKAVNIQCHSFMTKTTIIN